MPIRCSVCQIGTFEPARIARAPVSDLVGLEEVFVEDAPVLRCTHCAANTWEGTTITQIEEELARQLCTTAVLSGAELRYLRKFLEATPEDLAARLGVPVSTIERWERAEQSLSFIESLPVRALVALHLAASKPNEARGLEEHFRAPPPAARLPPYVVLGERFA